MTIRAPEEEAIRTLKAMLPESTIAGRRPAERVTAWHFCWPLLPISVNAAYWHGPNGKLFLTAEARGFKDSVAYDVASYPPNVRFAPELKKRYAVRVAFTMPNDARDIDNPLKLMIDALFGSKRDHRIYRLEVTKEVVPGKAQTEIWIEELNG